MSADREVRKTLEDTQAELKKVRAELDTLRTNQRQTAQELEWGALAAAEERHQRLVDALDARATTQGRALDLG